MTKIHKNTSEELIQLIDSIRYNKKKLINNFEDISNIVLKFIIKKVDGYKFENNDVYNLVFDYIENQKRVITTLEKELKERI